MRVFSRGFRRGIGPGDDPYPVDALDAPQSLASFAGVTITHFALLDAQGNILVTQPISPMSAPKDGTIEFSDITITVT